MAFFLAPSSLIHAAGNIAAPVLEGAGAINSAIGGGGDLTQIGHAISNPNKVYTGSLNPVTAINNTGGTSSFTGAASSPKANTTPATPTQTPQPQGATTTADSGLLANGDNANNPAYGMYAGNAQSALQSALNSYNNSVAGVGQQYNRQNNQLQSTLGQNTEDYNTRLTTQDQNKLTNDNNIQQSANQGYQSPDATIGVRTASGGSQGNLLSKARFRRRSSEPAESRSNPCVPSQETCAESPKPSRIWRSMINMLYYNI